MRLASIVPHETLPLVGQHLGDYHLCFTDFILDNEFYAHIYKTRRSHGEFVILDSMAFEKTELTDPTRMIEAIKILDPSEVVLPDALDDAGQTLASSKAAADLIIASGYTGSFMAVPHGTNYEEYLLCAFELQRLPGVRCLGVYEEAGQYFNTPRWQIARRLREEFGKKIHYLGATESMEELISPGFHKDIRGLDTAKHVVWGLAEMQPTVDNIPPYPGRSKFGGRMGFYDLQGITASQLACMLRNIEYWRTACET